LGINITDETLYQRNEKNNTSCDNAFVANILMPKVDHRTPLGKRSVETKINLYNGDVTIICKLHYMISGKFKQ